MNPLLKFAFGIANIPDAAVNDLERSWPGIKEIADTLKAIEPDLQAAAPHIAALEPILIKLWPSVLKIWPDVLDLLPVADEWINIVSKK